MLFQCSNDWKDKPVTNFQEVQNKDSYSPTAHFLTSMKMMLDGFGTEDAAINDEFEDLICQSSLKE